MRPYYTFAFASLFALAGAAHAQGVGPGTSPQPGSAMPAGAGQVPTLGQQPNSVISGRAGIAMPGTGSGSADEAGTNLPKSTLDSGTTTTFETSEAPSEATPWPCVQPKVSAISAGTIWSGPSIDEGKDWDDDNKLAELAQKLASRRTSLAEANDLITDFAKSAGADKDKKLTQLFTGTLDILNDDRNQILDGIMRYSRGQERLAERMRDESDKISEAQSNATAHDIGVATAQTNTDFAWDQRIFKERKQALSYVCDTPSALERRAYEIAKRIEAQL